MTEILPNPYIEKFNAEQNQIPRIIPITNLKPTREDIEKIVIPWFNKESKHKVFHLDELIDALYELISGEKNA